jgi:beta-glucosidase
MLQPQETRTVTFRLPAKDLAFVGADGQWVLEEGDFRLTIGTEQQTVTCE